MDTWPQIYTVILTTSTHIPTYNNSLSTYHEQTRFSKMSVNYFNKSPKLKNWQNELDELNPYWLISTDSKNCKKLQKIAKIVTNDELVELNRFSNLPMFIFFIQ